MTRGWAVLLYSLTGLLAFAVLTGLAAAAALILIVLLGTLV
jgi:hypothetical protein